MRATWRQIALRAALILAPTTAGAGACAHGTPTWVQRGTYAEDDTLFGVGAARGVSQAAAIAKNRARAAVVQLSRVTGGGEGGGPGATLQGVTIVDVHQEGGTWYALARYVHRGPRRP